MRDHGKHDATVRQGFRKSPAAYHRGLMYRDRPKRIVDCALAAVLLVGAAPLFLFAAAVTKLFSPGSILFTQERVGRDHVPFHMYKFRTMHPTSSEKAGSSVTIRNDPRIFLGGALLRKTKVDELPQLFNVLQGSMSLVGPRPTVEEDYRRMAAEQQRRCSVRPGLTGLAQIRGGTSLTWPQRIELDCAYINRCSLMLDLRILAETAWHVLTLRAESFPPGDDEWSDAVPYSEDTGADGHV